MPKAPKERLPSQRPSREERLAEANATRRNTSPTSSGLPRSTALREVRNKRTEAESRVRVLEKELEKYKPVDVAALNHHIDFIPNKQSQIERQ